MKPITILLAEDSFGDQMLFELALKESVDTHLEIVGDGDEALRFLQREGKYAGAPQPDLVVLDLNLPKVSGPEILTEMKKNPALTHLPVAMFSGAKPTGAVLDACKHADLYVVKPDRPDKYFAVVKSLEEYCRKILEFPNSTRKYAEEVQRLLGASVQCDVYIPGTSEQAAS